MTRSSSSFSFSWGQPWKDLGLGHYFPWNDDPKQIEDRKTFQLPKTKTNEAATLGDTSTKHTTLETRRNHQHSMSATPTFFTRILTSNSLLNNFDLSFRWRKHGSKREWSGCRNLDGWFGPFGQPFYKNQTVWVNCKYLKNGTFTRVHRFSYDTGLLWNTFSKVLSSKPRIRTLLVWFRKHNFSSFPHGVLKWWKTQLDVQQIAVVYNPNLSGLHFCNSSFSIE